MDRKETISDIKNNPEVQVLIVGAGINGLGTFRDLALNDVDVLIVDRGDLCSGASAASSHMAHGGIRYLENGEFRLVREAVQERNRMIKNAPHIVRPLPTTVPMFKYLSGLLNAPLKFLRLLDRPSERGSLVIKIGLMLYDAYTGKTGAVPRHRFLGRNASLKKWPRLNPNVVNTATYYDGSIQNPERLGLELALDAEAENPKARALNYVSLVSAQKDSVLLRDEITDETFEIKPRLLVNAAGPWIDFANKNMGLSTRFIGGTKGSHLVLNHSELREAIGENEFFFENNDGRIVLIFPLFDRVLIGTSDLPIENPDEARCTDGEINYFLGMVARVFPDIKVTHEHIVFRFSGVRPLAYGHARTTSQITRDHAIEVVSGDWTGLDFPVYSLVGGKWTSFRAFSEQTTDKSLAHLGMTRKKSTADLPIGGGRGFTRDEKERKRQLEAISAWTGLSMERVNALYERYGTRVESMSEFIKRDSDEMLQFLPEYSRREIEFLARHEKVIHLDDLILRRTMTAMLGRLTRAAVDELSGILMNALNWTGEQRKTETARALSILADRHGVRL
jgi:glycerol-3-phosphate dehydrogenase